MKNLFKNIASTTYENYMENLSKSQDVSYAIRRLNTYLGSGFGTALSNSYDMHVTL